MTLKSGPRGTGSTFILRLDSVPMAPVYCPQGYFSHTKTYDSSPLESIENDFSHEYVIDPT